MISGGGWKSAGFETEADLLRLRSGSLLGSLPRTEVPSVYASDAPE